MVDIPEKPAGFVKGNGGGVDLWERAGGRRHWEGWREGKLQSRCNVLKKNKSFKKEVNIILNYIVSLK